MNSREQKARETVIKNLREALKIRNEVASKGAIVEKDEAQQSAENSTIAFCKQYIGQGGAIEYCSNIDELTNALTQLSNSMGNPPIGCCGGNITSLLNQVGIANATNAIVGEHYSIGVLRVEALLAENGAAILSDNLGFGTVMAELPKVTLIIGFTSQIIPNWDAAVAQFKADGQEIPRSFTCMAPVRNASNAKRQIKLILVEDMQ